MAVNSKINHRPRSLAPNIRYLLIQIKLYIENQFLTRYPFRARSPPTTTKRINTRMTTPVEKPSCSKTGEQANCSNRRKEPPRPNTESSADWLKLKEQPRKQRRQLTSPDKSAGKPIDLRLQCYNTAEGKPVHVNIDDELHQNKLKN